jgi:FHA domain/von Willebrand factor type A domain
MKRSFSTRSGSATARLAGKNRRAIASARFVLAAAALVIATSISNVFAQMELNSVAFQSPSGKDGLLRADFFLQQANMGTSFSQADAVTTPVKVTANGTAVADSNVTFTKTADLPNYSCAVLLLVDNTLINRPGIDEKTKEQLRSSVRKSLLNFTAAAGVSPYNIEIATISNGNVTVLAAMGSGQDLLKGAIPAIKFDGDSPQLYLELKEAIRMFSQTPADRKFLVVFSDGVSNDQEKVASAADVVDAALKANIHICSIGFPTVAGSNVVQSLEPLAEKTGGPWIQATSPAQPAPSARPHTPAQADHSKFELPNGIEDSLLKLMASGGRVDVNLTGLTAPVDLVFTVQTQLKRAYTFAHKVDFIPAVPTPTPTVAQTPVSGPTPKPSPTPASSSLLDQIKSWLVNNAVVASAVAVAVLVLMFLLLLIVRRAIQPAAPEPIDDNDATRAPDLPPEPEPNPLAWLESLDGDQTRYPIAKTAIRIGRKSDNDIVMKNDTVSGHHAEILLRGSEFIIADLGSSNPIMVGGRQIQRASLQDGDIIELGEVRLRFLQPQAVDPDFRTKVIS